MSPSHNQLAVFVVDPHPSASDTVTIHRILSDIADKVLLSLVTSQSKR